MFPELYRAHHNLHSEDLSFWQQLADQSPGPVLELGCGAGRVLIPLAGAGHHMIGIEKDPDMLASLRRHCSAQIYQRIRLIQTDFTHFHLGLRFGLIMLPCNTYSTLNEAERRSTLHGVRAHLLPDGLFAVSMPNPQMLLDLPARSTGEVEEIFPHPGDGEPVQVSSAWRRTRREFILDWRYDHLLPDGSVERSGVSVRHQLVQLNTHLQEFRQAGFVHLDQFGDFNFSAYSPDSENLILIAR